MSIRDLQIDQQPIEVQILKTRFQQIEKELIETTPLLPVALVDIHKNLLQHEELVHLLDDDDLQILHQAHEKHKHFALIAKEVKVVKAGARKKLTEKDLGNL